MAPHHGGSSQFKSTPKHEKGLAALIFLSCTASRWLAWLIDLVELAGVASQWPEVTMWRFEEISIPRFSVPHL
jgi:hypothetical protein